MERAAIKILKSFALEFAGAPELNDAQVRRWCSGSDVVKNYSRSVRYEFFELLESFKNHSDGNYFKLDVAQLHKQFAWDKEFWARIEKKCKGGKSE